MLIQLNLVNIDIICTRVIIRGNGVSVLKLVISKDVCGTPDRCKREAIAFSQLLIYVESSS